MAQLYSLTDLAEITGLEARTIRSYIERGLLPNAQARGRAATYSDEHLSRLRVIQALRRARSTMALADIRIHLQQFTPQQIRDLAAGTITASVPTAESVANLGPQQNEGTDEDIDEVRPRSIDWEISAETLTGAERLVCVLREIGRLSAAVPQSKVETWHRISVTPDIELSVRAGFDEANLGTFRELADVLRVILQQPDVLSSIGVNDE